jgi:CheY-like chemotaxis protein
MRQAPYSHKVHCRPKPHLGVRFGVGRILLMSANTGSDLGTKSGTHQEEKAMLIRPPAVLVVEDEALIALLIEDALDAAGYRPCGIAGSEADALRLADKHYPNFAVLDINLGMGGSGLNVGRKLHPHGVELLYASGNCEDYLAEMADTGARAYLNKPYAPSDVPRALDALGRWPAGKPPPDLPDALKILAVTQ